MTTHETASHIQSLLNKYTFTLAFDICRYSVEDEALTFISIVASQHHQRCIFSAGVRFKTDLMAQGGHGMDIYHPHSYSASSINRIIRDAEVMQRLLFGNKLALLEWGLRLEAVKVVLMWSCVQCQKEQPETVEAYRKFGKQFCSIKCLKSHKFWHWSFAVPWYLPPGLGLIKIIHFQTYDRGEGELDS